MRKLQCLRAERLGFAVVLISAAALASGLQPAKEKAVVAHVVINSSVEEKALSSADVGDLFLGNKRQWKDGSRVKLALLKDPLSQQKFLKEVAGRSPARYWAHWRKIVFSGQGLMPKIFATEKELLAYVAAEKGAIGQISGTNPVKNVTVRVEQIIKEEK